MISMEAMLLEMEGGEKPLTDKFKKHFLPKKTAAYTSVGFSVIVWLTDNSTGLSIGD